MENMQSDPEKGLLGLVLKESRRKAKTRLKAYKQTDADIVVAPMFYHMMSLASKVDEIPRRGTTAYSRWIDKLWKEEPILAGAVYSMVAKMQAMNWKVEGGRNNSKRTAEMLARAQYMLGSDWAGFIGSSAIDFYTQDNGVWWDVTRQGGKWGRMTDLAHIDTRNCIPTGNANVPMYYSSSVVGHTHMYKPGEYMHFASMILPNEGELGLGYCACSRAARAAKLLMALHSYDAEKLQNLPPEGIASVTGLTDREFRQAIRLWLAERKKNNSLTFPQVLWLIGSNPNATVSVDIASFSTIPESFDRQTVVAQYVNTLALCFGVDTREFWAISTGALGTASEAEVQHLKARGKGGGEFITMVESQLNAELPDDVIFKFDTQDIEEDMVSATVAHEWIQAYLPLVAPALGGEQIIDAKTFMRLLADKGVVPEWVVGDDRVVVSSYEIHKEELEDIVRFIWECGKLSGRLLAEAAPINVRKEELIVNTELLLPIRGTPIEGAEVLRGARVTGKAIRSEMEIWGTIPELQVLLPEGAA